MYVCVCVIVGGVMYIYMRVSLWGCYVHNIYMCVCLCHCENVAYIYIYTYMQLCES